MHQKEARIIFKLSLKNKKPPHRQNPDKGGFSFHMARIRVPIRSSIKRLYKYPYPPALSRKLSPFVLVFLLKQTNLITVDSLQKHPVIRHM